MNFTTPRSRNACAAAALALVLCAQALAARPPDALVTGLSGNADLLRPARPPRHLAVLDDLLAGDTLRLAPGAAVEVVVMAAAEVATLTGPGTYRVEAKALMALDRGRVAARDLVGDWRALRLYPGSAGRASVSLRGTPDAPLVARYPSGGVRAGTLDALRWDAPAGSWKYSVTVIDPDGEAVFAADATASSVALPPALAWPAGADFVWTVAGIDADGRRAESSAQFHVIAPDAQALVAAANGAAGQARRRAGSGASAEDVLLALLLDQQGLRSDADRQWRLVSSARDEYAGRIVLTR